MEMPELTERDILRIDAALKEAEKPDRYGVVPYLPAMLNELEAWVGDEHQWRSGWPPNWSTLLSDLDSSLQKGGDNLAARLKQSVGHAREELRLVRSRLTQGKSPPDESTRRRLQRVGDAVRAELMKDTALIAAWADIIAAEGPSQSVDLARLLLSIGDLRGHAQSSLVRSLRAILSDDAAAILSARGVTHSAEEGPDKAGASAGERLELAEKPLVQLPRRGQAIVWLTYALAPPLEPPVLPIGDHVALYNMACLRSAVRGDKLLAHLLPKEVIDDPFALSMLVGDDEREKAQAASPYIAIRIDLGNVRMSEAEKLARQSAETLVAMAALHGADTSPWILEDSYAMYVDGASGPWSFSAPAVFTPSSDQRAALAGDWTAEVIRKEAKRWGPHFPINDERMQQAAHLLIWLRKARETWAPARLVLCDRIIERVSGWAGVENVGRLIHDHIKLSWSIGCMRAELANCGWAAVHPSDPMSPIGDRERLEWLNRASGEILSDPDIGISQTPQSWSVNPSGVLKKLDWLSKRVPDGSPVEERIKRLRRRTCTGQAAAAWADELMNEFERLAARSRRVRNVLIHGGPESDKAADGVVPFVETMAVDALYTAVDGRFNRVDLVDFFLERRAQNVEILRTLRAGKNPADALWQAEESRNA
jgi:hypothetical protein